MKLHAGAGASIDEFVAQTGIRTHSRPAGVPAERYRSSLPNADAKCTCKGLLCCTLASNPMIDECLCIIHSFKFTVKQKRNVLQSQMGENFLDEDLSSIAANHPPPATAMAWNGASRDSSFEGRSQT